MDQNKKYSKYALVEEMLETTEVIKNFDPSISGRFISTIREKGRLFLTGEGSSRLFPAKRAIYEALKKGNLLPVSTEGATQALEYNLSNYAVFGASNSGKTKEIVRLFEKLKNGEDFAFVKPEIHHRDRNRENNRMDNLLILCPNCHSLMHWNIDGSPKKKDLDMMQEFIPCQC